MTSAGYAIILVLSVIFITVLLSVLIKRNTDKIITKIDDSPDFVEVQLRRILKENPKSEIYILNKSKNAESLEIIEKLSRDFPQIHIKD